MQEILFAILFLEKFNNLCLYFSLSFLFVLLFNHNINKQSDAIFPLFRITLVIYFGHGRYKGFFRGHFFLEEIMEVVVGLDTFQFNELAKKEFIRFCKSKDFENLSVKEKKEVLIERINSSYFIKNLYNLFALSYERLLKKDDSTFSNLDTMMSVFVEEFNNIQMEELGNILEKSKNCKKTTATELESYFAEQFKNIQTEEFEKRLESCKGNTKAKIQRIYH